MGKDLRFRKECLGIDEENTNNKSKYTKTAKIRFALNHGAKELKVIMNGKPVDSEYIETRKPIHR